MKANADMVLCWLNPCIKLGSYASKRVYQDLLEDDKAPVMTLPVRQL